VTKSLKDGLVPDEPDPTLGQLDTTREQQTATGDGLVDVFLTSGVRTSAGPGPGHKRVPVHEANLIVAARVGVRGTEPPRNFTDGGQPQGAAPAVREYGSQVPVRSAQAN